MSDEYNTPLDHGTENESVCITAKSAQKLGLRNGSVGSVFATQT